MKKYTLAIVMFVMVTIISGCSVNADATSDITYPTLTELTETKVEPYKIEIETVEEALEEPGVEERPATRVVSGGASWIYAKTQDGVRGTKTTQYKKTYNLQGELLSRVEVPESVTYNNTKPTLYEGGQKAQPGAYFTSSRITRYGVDCAGCNMNSEGKGSTSSGVGVGVDSVRQKDGTWKPGITYEGYYILAASSALPLCTIVEVSNHNFSGSGITPGVPFKAIVLDRGGAIQGSKLDIYTGSERSMALSQGRGWSVDVEILSLNSRSRTSTGWNCNI